MKYPDDIQLKAHILQLIKGFCFLYLLKLICMFSHAHSSHSNEKQQTAYNKDLS